MTAREAWDWEDWCWKLMVHNYDSLYFRCFVPDGLMRWRLMEAWLQ